MSIKLKNPPLVEAIFELRWKLHEHENKNIRYDPHYKLLIGRLYDRICDKYPFHEQLKTAEIPDEIAHYIIQHRFRIHENKWPLVQLGPGIITVNEMEEYDWGAFLKNIDYVIYNLFNAYPDQKNIPEVESLLLRYIDAEPFNFEKDDVVSFLKRMLNTDIKLCPPLFEGTSVKKAPRGINLLFSFNFEKPKSVIHLRIVRGKKNDTECLFWETMVESTKEKIPQKLSDILSWVKISHDITDNWFFKIIDGELLRRYK